MLKALVVLADGFEEMEAIAPIDLLRRAHVQVTIAGLAGTSLTGRNGLNLMAEVPFASVANDTFDLVVIPGGPAFKILRQEPTLLALLRIHEAKGKTVAAICAAPTVLLDAGLLEKRQYTAHYSVRDELPDLDLSRSVVEDGGVITSQGAGTATEFALALVNHLCGEQVAKDIAASICFDR